MNFTMRRISRDELNRLEPLWQKLNQLHLQDSKYFKEHYETFTFEKRCEKFLAIDEEDIYIEIVEDGTDNIIAYCISNIEKRVGEIDSLFVEEEYRGIGIGKKLVQSAIEWLKKKRCKKILVSVSYGHENVFNFYMSNGFYPRLTYLELKE